MSRRGHKFWRHAEHFPSHWRRWLIQQFGGADVHDLFIYIETWLEAARGQERLCEAGSSIDEVFLTEELLQSNEQKIPQDKVVLSFKYSKVLIWVISSLRSQRSRTPTGWSCCVLRQLHCRDQVGIEADEQQVGPAWGYSCRPLLCPRLPSLLTIESDRAPLTHILCHKAISSASWF